MEKYFIILFIISLLFIIAACHPEQMYHTLTILVEPAGSGIITPDNGKYVHGRQLVLTAESNPGFMFKHWLFEENEIVAVNPVSIVMDRDRTISACFSTIENPPDCRTWTIMVWLDADNNLEPNGIKDFNEMEYGLNLAKQTDPYIEDKLAIVVQFDRIPGFDTGSHDSGDDWVDTRRYLIKPDSNENLNGDFSSQLLSQIGEVNMGDAYELKSFIKYCKNNYPAEHYFLILWNHGAGAKSPISSFGSSSKEVCIDNTNGGDNLFTGELTDVLTQDESVDIIGFDACYMGVVEVAYEYRPGLDKFSADYMIGSAAIEDDNGWKYYTILNRLKGSSYLDPEGDECYNANELTAEQLACIIAKEYKDCYAQNSDLLMTVVDLQSIEELKNTFDILSGHLIDKKEDIEILRGSGVNIDMMNYFLYPAVYYLEEEYWMATPHFDLYDFASKVFTFFNNDQVLSESAQNLMIKIDECTIASFRSTSDSFPGFEDGKNGLGFFLPDGDRLLHEYGDPHYSYQYWYSGSDLYSAPTLGFYGNIDFCITDSDGVVENWKELLEYWYDNMNTLTPYETW